MLLEVDGYEYRNFYRDIERKKYCKKLKKTVTTISLDEIIDKNEDFRVKDFIRDDNIDIENDIEKKIELEKLKNALLQLNKDEYKLIKALFFEQKSIREYAETIDIPYSTIQYKKAKILKKLKKILKI